MSSFTWLPTALCTLLRPAPLLYTSFRRPLVGTPLNSNPGHSLLSLGYKRPVLSTHFCCNAAATSAARTFCPSHQRPSPAPPVPPPPRLPWPVVGRGCAACSRCTCSGSGIPGTRLMHDSWGDSLRGKPQPSMSLHSTGWLRAHPMQLSPERKDPAAGWRIEAHMPHRAALAVATGARRLPLHLLLAAEHEPAQRDRHRAVQQAQQGQRVVPAHSSPAAAGRTMALSKAGSGLLHRPGQQSHVALCNMLPHSCFFIAACMHVLRSAADGLLAVPCAVQAALRILQLRAQHSPGQLPEEGRALRHEPPQPVAGRQLKVQPQPLQGHAAHEGAVRIQAASFGASWLLQAPASSLHF